MSFAFKFMMLCIQQQSSLQFAVLFRLENTYTSWLSGEYYAHVAELEHFSMKLPQSAKGHHGWRNISIMVQYQQPFSWVKEEIICGTDPIWVAGQSAYELNINVTIQASSTKDQFRTADEQEIFVNLPALRYGCDVYVLYTKFTFWWVRVALSTLRVLATRVHICTALGSRMCCTTK